MRQPDSQENFKDSSVEQESLFIDEEGGEISPVVETVINPTALSEIQSLRLFLITQTIKSILKLTIPFSVGIILLFQQQLSLGLFLIGWSLYISGIINEEDIEKALDLAKKILSIKDAFSDKHADKSEQSD